MKKLNLGLIGAGRIGRVHAESITRRITTARLHAVADISQAAAQTCAQEFGIPVVHPDPQTLLQDPNIQAVVICSSTDTHAQFIRDAAAAGKHIFCEKPIALDLAAIDTALDAVERAGVKLQIGFNRRFDANFRHLHDVVCSGGIGTPHLVRITSRDPAPPPLDYIRVSGGIFLDMTIHDFDMARFLVGEEVVDVYATGGALIDPAIGDAGDIDTAVVTLRFANGAIGIIENSRQAVYGYDQRAEVFGSQGSVESQNVTPSQIIWRTAEHIHSPKPLYFFLERYMDSYVAEINAFVAAIQNETEPPVTGIDGRMPVVMGLAAWRSYHEGRVVALNEIHP